MTVKETLLHTMPIVIRRDDSPFHTEARFYALEATMFPAMGDFEIVVCVVDANGDEVDCEEEDLTPQYLVELALVQAGREAQKQIKDGTLKPIVYENTLQTSDSSAEPLTSEAAIAILVFNGGDSDTANKDLEELYGRTFTSEEWLTILGLHRWAEAAKELTDQYTRRAFVTT